jgi:hypothetical protein
MGMVVKLKRWRWLIMGRRLGQKHTYGGGHPCYEPLGVTSDSEPPSGVARPRQRRRSRRQSPQAPLGWAWTGRGFSFGWGGVPFPRWVGWFFRLTRW